MTDDAEPITLVGVTPSDSTTRREVTFDRDGVITGAKVVTHRGQQYALQNFATLIQDGRQTSLWRSLDAEYVAGNGQVFDFRTRRTFEENDTLVFEIKNVNQDGEPYHHNLTVSVDYDEQRGGLLGRL
jgi:hypothetical protein